MSEVQQRGDQASQILNNPAFREAMSVVKATYIDAMLATELHETEKRTAFHIAIRSLTDIETALTIFLETGKLDKLQTVKKEKAKNGQRDKQQRTSKG